MIVVYTTSHNVDQYLPTALNSLFIHNPNAFVYIIAEDDTIDCIKRTKNIKIISKKNIPNFITSNHRNVKNFSEMVLSRCWLSKILDENKILYLDIDTLVLDNLDDLWNIDITNYAMAGWAEPNNDGNSVIKNKLDHYINSGVLLMNLDFIRQNKLDDKIIEYINNNTLLYPDQDAINAVCYEYIKYIDPIYNFSNLTTKNIPPIEEVKIYHMVNFKFWNNKNSNHKYHYLWDKYYIKDLV